jgi:uncharacterized protein
VKIEGTYTIPAARDLVWQKLLDPETLSKSMPGCEGIEPDGSGAFNVVLKIGIGPIKGSYSGRVEITDPVPLQSYRMKVEGKGAGGFIKGEGALTLSGATGGVALHYSGNAQVCGLIACVGQRLVEVAARQIVNQFFQSFAKQFQKT